MICFNHENIYSLFYIINFFNLRSLKHTSVDFFFFSKMNRETGLGCGRGQQLTETGRKGLIIG